MGYRTDWNRYAMLNGRSCNPCGSSHPMMRPSLGQFPEVTTRGVPSGPTRDPYSAGMPGRNGAPIEIPSPDYREGGGLETRRSSYDQPMASSPGPLGPTFTSYSSQPFIEPEPVVAPTNQFFSRGETIPVFPQANFPPIVDTISVSSPTAPRPQDSAPLVLDYDSQDPGTIWNHPTVDIGGSERMVLMDGGFFPEKQFEPPPIPVMPGEDEGMIPEEEPPYNGEEEEALPLDMNNPAHVFLMTTMGKNEACFFESSEFGLYPLEQPPLNCEVLWSRLMVELGFEDEAIMQDLQLFYLTHREEFLALYKATSQQKQEAKKQATVPPPQPPKTTMPTPEPTNWLPWVVGGGLLLGAAYYFWPKSEAKGTT